MRWQPSPQGYGASVVKIYSPNATWSKVKSQAQGANLLIYLGHGNGWPSPYKPYQPYTKDGLGLNKSSGNGNSNLKYWGEYYVRNYLHLAPNAVVILNHACYTAGSSEPGRADPSKSTAIKRVDNYGAGFLRTGAKAVFAERRRARSRTSCAACSRPTRRCGRSSGAAPARRKPTRSASARRGRRA